MRTVSEFKVENYLDADADALIASRKLLHANVCWCCLAEGIMFDEQHKEKQLFTNCSMKNPHFEFHEISNHFSVSTLLAVGYSSDTVASSTVGSPDGGISKESNETSKESADGQDILISNSREIAANTCWTRFEVDNNVIDSLNELCSSLRSSICDKNEISNIVQSTSTGQINIFVSRILGMIKNIVGEGLESMDRISQHWVLTCANKLRDVVQSVSDENRLMSIAKQQVFSEGDKSEFNSLFLKVSEPILSNPPQWVQMEPTDRSACRTVDFLTQLHLEMRLMYSTLTQYSVEFRVGIRLKIYGAETVSCFQGKRDKPTEMPSTT